MDIKNIYLVLIILTCSRCQHVKQIQIIKSGTNTYVNDHKPNKVLSRKEILKNKPPYLAQHAHLIENDQDGAFILYQWVEYMGIVDKLNFVHKIRVCEQNGSSPINGFYFMLNQSSAVNINLHNYQIKNADGRILELISDGIAYKLLYFNYMNDSSYETMFKPTATDFKNYSLVTSYNSAKQAPAPDVWIKVLKYGDSYNVNIENEFHEFENHTYELHFEGSPYTRAPLMPFRYRYFEIMQKRIFLLEKGWSLIRKDGHEIKTDD